MIEKFLTCLGFGVVVAIFGWLFVFIPMFIIKNMDSFALQVVCTLIYCWLLGYSGLELIKDEIMEE